MKKLISISILFCLISCYNQEKPVDKSKLMGNDYRLFQSTPAWTLAKAVEAGDIKKIKEEVLQKKVWVDYQESRFGQTLLMLAIFNNEYDTAKTLLELGANPNLHTTFKGKTSVIVAADNDDPKYLKLVLAYKGDPNSIENVFSGPKKRINSERNSALTTAIVPSVMGKKNLEKVKLLVEAGADINYTKKGIIQTALAEALIQEQMDIALYLIEKGADYKKPITLFVGGGREDVTVLYLLRSSIIDLDSEQYKKKMELVAFLKSKGLDYEKEPIDEADIERMKNMYPDNWQEYMKRY
ncbi:MAG: ankyrin repeat domain-containing protein [Flavobacterium sp.]|nr:ankyrin repeat domain-containing protein [Flavobacterium sp.]